MAANTSAPTSTTTVILSRLSRYKDTNVFLAGPAVEFGLWEAPAEFQGLPAGAQTHTVKANEVGFLDIIAVLWYGAGYEEMWWSIAQANAIINQETEMYPGMALVIPTQNLVSQFAARAGLASAGAGSG